MNVQPRARGERPCPVCGQQMSLARRGKIEIDVCEPHGVWLDHGELEAIAQRVAGFERIRGKHAVARARRDARELGKVSGWLFGPLAFLFD